MRANWLGNIIFLKKKPNKKNQTWILALMDLKLTMSQQCETKRTPLILEYTKAVFNV